MATFEYRCDNCDHEWEEWQSISDPVIEVCPLCSVHAAKKQCSSVKALYGGMAYLLGERSYSASTPSGKVFTEKRSEAAQAGDGTSKTGLK